MKESIFGEFQYFIRRINTFRNGGKLAPNESIEDLEQRFRMQIERGLVVHEPHAQEIVMEVLLSDLPEAVKKGHILSVRRTGKTDFELKASHTKKLHATQGLTLEQKKEKALDLIILALKKVGLKVQKQPLAVKMYMAEYELKDVDYDDPKDLKLLLVKTVQISGHAKKVNPNELAKTFSDMVSRL
tara:strand:- start:1113 stop:1670 length:558 start_codon:yes stop_codon:yes gene_type:complete